MKKIFPFIILIIMWQCFAMTVNRQVIIPYPAEVLAKMMAYGQNIQFYISLLYTLLRIIAGLIIASLIGITLAFASYDHQYIEANLSPIVAFFQTIPQISYIIILLVWFSSKTQDKKGRYSPIIAFCNATLEVEITTGWVLTDTNFFSNTQAVR